MKGMDWRVSQCIERREGNQGQGEGEGKKISDFKKNEIVLKINYKKYRRID